MEEIRCVSKKFECISCKAIFKKLVRINEDKTCCEHCLYKEAVIYPISKQKTNKESVGKEKDLISRRKSSDMTRKKAVNLILSNNKKYENIIKKLKRSDKLILSPFNGSVKRHSFNKSILDKYKKEFYVDFSDFFLDNFSSNYSSNFLSPITKNVFISSQKKILKESKTFLPTSVNTINRLKCFNYSEDFSIKTSDGNPEFPECSSCLKEINPVQNAILIPCGHLYHSNCALEFLSKINQCFVCKYELVEDDIEIEDITQKEINNN